MSASIKSEGIGTESKLLMQARLPNYGWQTVPLGTFTYSNQGLKAAEQLYRQLLKDNAKENLRLVLDTHSTRLMQYSEASRRFVTGKRNRQ